jgi:hypothetical protein
MSILKNFQYTQVDTKTFSIAIEKLKNDKKISSDEFFSIAYNLNKIDDLNNVLLKLLESDTSNGDKKKLSKLISLESVILLLGKEDKYLRFFMYPKVFPVSLCLLVLSLFLKPFGFGIIAGYLIACLNISKYLRNKLYNRFSKE